MTDEVESPQTAPPPAATQPDPAPVASPPSDAGSPAPAQTVEPAGDWPSDWRAKAAGGDDKLLKMLERYNSPVDGFKALAEARNKISSGEYKKQVAPPEDAEQLALWRKENGVPDTHESYDLSMPEGIVIGDDDKPFVDAFLKSMHEKNMPAGPVKEAVAAYYKLQQDQIAAAVQADRAFQQETEEALRSEWGYEYKPNFNMAENFAVTRFGEEVGRAILQAGPEAVKAVAALAREINPAGTLVPNSNNPTQAISDELNQLKKEIGTPAWYADTSKQARYQQLVAAQQAYSSR